MAALAERQIARSAGTVMVGFGLSSLLGLANRMLYTRAFGSGQELDAFLAANRVPDILFNLMAGGALASAFLPTFSALLAQGDRRRAWQMASGVGNLLILALALAAGLLGLAAPWVVENILAPGFHDPEQIQLTVSLLRIQLVAPVIFGISGLLMAILNAEQHFLLPALAPTFHWLGWILGSLFLVPRLGISGLAWGMLLGAALHLSIQLPGLRRLRPRYAPTLGLKDPSVRQVGRLMAPRLFGVGVVQLNFLVNLILASGMPEGSLTGITLGFAIMLMPQIVIAQAVAIAALPTFSSQAAKGELAEMRRALASTLRGVIFLSLPASLGLFLLRVPLVTLLFQRGEFDTHSTELVAWAVLWYSTGLVGHALVEIVSRAFYALKDTRTPVTVGAAAMALNVVLSIGLSRLFLRLGWLPHGGLALANSIATGLEAIALLWLVSRRLEGIEIARIRPGIAASLLATAAMGFGLMLWLAVTEGRSAWVVALGGVGLGAAAYWLASLGLRSPEARQLPRLILARRG
jgi:putative peptidoglycan lipid II flippase